MLSPPISDPLAFISNSMRSPSLHESFLISSALSLASSLSLPPLSDSLPPSDSLLSVTVYWEAWLDAGARRHWRQTASLGTAGSLLAFHLMRSCQQPASLQKDWVGETKPQVSSGSFSAQPGARQVDWVKGEGLRGRMGLGTEE